MHRNKNNLGQPIKMAKDAESGRGQVEDVGAGNEAH